MLLKYEEIFKKISKGGDEVEVDELRKTMDFELKYFHKEIADYLFNVLTYTSQSDFKLFENEEDDDDENDKDSEFDYKALGKLAIKKKHVSVDVSDSDSEGKPKKKKKIKEEEEEKYMDFSQFNKISVENKSVLTNSSKKIKFPAFLNVMRAWASFSSADLNFDNYLSINELKMLLWIYENEEPNEWRLKAEMKEIDSDGNLSIDRLEWLKHLCVEDQKSGKQIFRSEIKRLFEKYDKNHTGYLSNAEVKKLIKNIFKGYVKKAKDEKTKYNLTMIISNLSKEIIEALNVDGDKNLNWSEFKYFIDKTLEKQANLAKFLESTMV